MGRRGAARVSVLAGVNGAGKSSIGGAAVEHFGGQYFNPDEAARRIRLANPGLTQRAANGAAWQQGCRLLERAIAERLDFVLETTLGGNTIPRRLAAAAADGVEIHVWYVGLEGPELHLARVRARVRRGGHDIPEADIRRRYRHSRVNLIHLLPALTSLRMYDNSAEADPAEGRAPDPRLVLEMQDAAIVNAGALDNTPEWAKAIVAAALKLQR